MPRSSRNQIQKRTTKLQVSFNESELRDVELLEATEGIIIQEIIRALIKAKAKTLRESKLE